MADERTPRRLAVRERGERTYTVGIDKNYARTYTENEMRAMGTEFPTKTVIEGDFGARTQRRRQLCD